MKFFKAANQILPFGETKYKGVKKKMKGGKKEVYMHLWSPRNYVV